MPRLDLRALLLIALTACSESAPRRPNVVWVVWDTVRADHMSLYGYERATTPFLDKWAANARVYEDCLSSSSWTVPSHASMFTGLLPAEHGAMHGNEYLAEELTTVAEALRSKGYQTFAWAANPHVSKAENFLQGFDVQQHPWDETTLARAVEIFKQKVPETVATRELQERLDKRGPNPWVVKAAGELGREGFSKWLDARDPSRPFLAFFNFMEAHRPLIPQRKFREQLLSPAEVEATYATQFDWKDTWAYCFGQYEYSPEQLSVLRDTYDSALLELDHLFAELMAELDRRGLNDDTLVILTADHGENLGDLHMLDHQYAVNQALLRVPLVLRFPAKFAPGRDHRPVMSMDLHPTLLELAGIAVPDIGVRHARSLLATKDSRVRLGDYSKPFPGPLESARKNQPTWDISRFERGLFSIVEGRWKLVREVGGDTRLHDLQSREGETRNVAAEHPEIVARLNLGLGRLWKSMRPLTTSNTQRDPSQEHLEMLNLLGYADLEQEDPEVLPEKLPKRDNPPVEQP